MADFDICLNFRKTLGTGPTRCVRVKAWVDEEIGVTVEFYSTRTGKRLPEAFDAWLRMRGDFDRLVTTFSMLSSVKERPFDG